MTVTTLKERDTMPQLKQYGCAKCGELLSDDRLVHCQAADEPLSCSDHEHEVIAEADQGHSMWPSGWAGGCYQTGSGRWVGVPMRISTWLGTE